MKKLERNEMKKIKGGLFNGGGFGTCTSTCWCQPVGGEECGNKEVPNCQGANAYACKTISGCENVPKATCSCDSGS